MKKTIMCVLIAGLATAVCPARAELPDTVTEKTYLYEITRHLYRWVLDENHLQKALEAGAFDYLLAERDANLDEGDESRYVDIVLPQCDVMVTVKRAKYAIPELDLHVDSPGFQIVNIARPPNDLTDEKWSRITLDYEPLRDYCTATRFDAGYPEGELLERMRGAVRARMGKELKKDDPLLQAERHIVHLAPLSPVANECWVFWENGNRLIRFASDIDMNDPAFWEHDELAADVYDVRTQTVVSLDEVKGSNAYLTRDQVGRALFNCIVLGKRLELEPVR